MNPSVKAADVAVRDTVEIVLSHNYPVEIIKTNKGLRWVVAQNRSGAKSKFVTHFIGTVQANNITDQEFQIYGGPYAGQGLGESFTSHGDDYTALAIIPWNFVMRMWVLTQKEIPDISAFYGRMSMVRTMVKF